MYIYFLLAALVAVFDLLTKLWVQNVFSYGEQVPVLPFFNLVYVRNTGTSFSMFSAASPAIITGVACLITVGICYFLIKEKSVFTKVCLALILGGAVGNIIDRICFGAVTDFMDFYIGQWHWPAFNVADSAICIGVLLLLYQAFFMKEKK